MLVSIFFLTASQPTSNYSALTATSPSDFTAYKECISRSPISLDSKDSLLNTSYANWTDKCVVGLAPRWKSSPPTSDESQFYQAVSGYITSKLGLAHVFFDSIEEMRQEANNYTVWAGIAVDTSNPDVTIGSELPYSIHLTASLLPAAVYPDKEPNVFFSLISNFLARGALKFEYSGFYYLQSVVETALVNFKLDRLGVATNSSSTSNNVLIRAWTAPYTSLSTSVPLVILLSASLILIAYIPPIMLAAFDLVSERKAKSYMKLLGIPETLYQVSWFIYVLLTTLLTSAIIFAGSAILGLMNGIAGAAFLIVLLFSISLTTLVFLVAGISRSKQVAAVVVVTIIGFAPNSLAIFLTNASLPTKVIFSIFSPLAFVFSLVECLKIHLIQAHQLAVIPDDVLALGEYSLPLGLTMLLLDSLLYMLLGWYFYNTKTKRNPRPLFFCCYPAYWRRREPAAGYSLELAEQSPSDEASSPPSLSGSSEIVGSASPDSVPSTPRPSVSPGSNVNPAFERLPASRTEREHYKEAKRAMLEEMDRLGRFAQSQDPRRKFATTRLPAPFGVGLRLINVSKMHEGIHTIDLDENSAITNFNIEAMRNEVLVLVGDRGSGKSTLIQLMAGLTSPNSGNIEIEGKDIVAERREARSLISLCAQESWTLSDLSIRQHVILASRLKCMPDSDEDTRVDHLLDSLKLLPIQHQRISHCTWSERKRAALAVSICADSRIILLDDPTSGLDPESREAIWNVIIANKIGRTIVVTTHIMAEADALGDRVGILDHGSLAAFGSPSFLKRHFGVGYYLNINKAAQSDPKSVVEFVQQRVAGSKVVRISPASDTLMRFTLPFSYQAQYPDLFQDLETQIDAYSDLGIESYSVSLTTLEDVFEQHIIGSNAVKFDRSASPESGALSDSDDSSDSSDSVDLSMLSPKDVLPAAASRSASVFQQLRVSIILRFRMLLRDLPVVIFILMVPLLTVALIWLASVFGTTYLQLPQILNGTRTSANVEPVELSFAQSFPIEIPYVSSDLTSPEVIRYSNTSAVRLLDTFYTLPSYWIYAFPARANLSSAGFTTHAGLGEYLWQDANPGHRLTAWIVESWSFNASSHSIGLLYNKTESYSLPASYNLLSNSILGAYLLRNISHNGTIPTSLSWSSGELEAAMSAIRLTMDPFDKIPDVKAISYNFDTSLLSSFTLFDVALSLGLATCLATILAIFAREQVYERVMKIRLQQLIMGASLGSYWMSVMVVDSCRLIIVFAIIIISGLIFQFDIFMGMYLGAFVLLALLWIPAALFMAYVISGFFSAPKSCYKWILLAFWSMYVLNYVVTFSVQIERLVVLQTFSTQVSGASAFFLNYFSFLNPFSTLSSALFDLSTVQKDFAIHNISPSFSYLMEWDHVGRHLCFLALHSFMWGMLLFGSQYVIDVFRSRRARASIAAASINATAGESLRLTELDTSVASEANDTENFGEDIDIRRIRTRITAGEYVDSVVRVDNASRFALAPGWFSKLRHLYNAQRSFKFKDISEQAEDIHHADIHRSWFDNNEGLLVGNAYFVVQPGQCFGVLGPVGAGKSTLLSLLSAELQPHSGSVSVNHISTYIGATSLYRSTRISYAPPSPIFSCFDHLTVLENLTLFFCLRNQLSTAELNTMTSYTLAKMDLLPFANSLCKDLHTVAKRRLCLAIALCTGSRIAFLDEPTAEMEPSEKASFWSFLAQLREETGLTVVITTNNLTEANATCEHYGIFVKGRFHAMGSAEYLKNRFEEGYTLKVFCDESKIADDLNESVLDMESASLDIIEPLSVELEMEALDRLDVFIKDNFSNSRPLVNYGRERIYFLGLLESPAWAFDLIETNKETLKISEYSLSQTTLLEVFNQFSRNQEIPS